MMRENRIEILAVLEDVMRVRGLNKASLSRDMGVSHETVSSWLLGKDTPGMQSCLKLAKYLDMDLGEVLYLTGHISERTRIAAPSLPEFREYIETKYPGLFDDEDILAIQQFIERRRIHRGGS